MTRINRLLIANRGEIALRIIRSAADAGLQTCAIAPADDAASLHVMRADQAQTLPGQGARAYLDIDAVIAAGVAAGCDAVHPGYDFSRRTRRLPVPPRRPACNSSAPPPNHWRSTATRLPPANLPANMAYPLCPAPPILSPPSRLKPFSRRCPLVPP
mgnify:CR=1 FL=1